MKELQIGDEIYRKSYYHGLSTAKVDRVTKTRAFCGTDAFTRAYSDEGHIEEYPRSSEWNRSSYWVGTDELKARYKKQVHVKFLTDVKWDDHNIETLNKVMETIGK